MVLGVAAVGIGFLMYQCGLVMFGVAAFIGLPAYLLGMASAAQWGLNLHGGAGRAGGQRGVRRAGGARWWCARGRCRLPCSRWRLAQMLKLGLACCSAMRPHHRRRRRPDDELQRHLLRPHAVAAGQGQPASGRWPGSRCAACCCWCGSGPRNSRFGQVLRATQANEERMRFSGFDTYWPRLRRSLLASVPRVGVAGVLMALNSGLRVARTAGLRHRRPRAGGDAGGRRGHRAGAAAGRAALHLGPGVPSAPPATWNCSPALRWW